MTDTPSRSGSRVILLLGILLVAAIAVVVWLTMRPDAAQPETTAQPTSTNPKTDARPPAPHVPRTKDEELVAYEPKSPIRPPIDTESADSADAAPLKLDVEVFGDNGLAAPGATVLLLDPFAQHVAGGGRVEIANKKADEAGRARFDVTGRTLRVYAWLGRQAAASDKFRPSDANSRVVVRMSSAIAGRGRVVEAQGERPVAGASVRLVARPWMGDGFGLALETVSATDGTFALPPIEASPFESVPEGGAWIEARAKTWPTAGIEVDADSLRAGEVVVPLERGAFLRGRLVRPTGGAVGNTELRLADGRSAVDSGEDGRFELPLTRDGGVVVSMPDLSPEILQNGHKPSAAWGAPKLLGRFRGDAGDIDLGDVTLAAGQPVKGVVVYADEKPVKAGEVVLYLAGVKVAATQTDDAGTFEFDTIGDDPHVIVATEAPGENAASGRRHASVGDVRGGASDVRVVITGALSVLAKFLTLADKSPVVVPEVRVRVDAAGATPRQYSWSYAGSRVDQFRLEVEHAGTYTATFELPGYEPATTEPFDVSADREVLISVLFRKRP